MTMKDTNGKPKLSLLPYVALAEIADVREYGIKKYKDDQGWKTVNPTDFLDAALRHINKYTSGEDLDAESGLNHIAHAACSLVLALGVIDDEDNRLAELLKDLDPLDREADDFWDDNCTGDVCCFGEGCKDKEPNQTTIDAINEARVGNTSDSFLKEEDIYNEVMGLNDRKVSLTDYPPHDEEMHEFHRYIYEGTNRDI